MSFKVDPVIIVFAVGPFRGVFYQGHSSKLVQYFFLEQFYSKPPLACTDFSHDFLLKPKQWSLETKNLGTAQLQIFNLSTNDFL